MMWSSLSGFSSTSWRGFSRGSSKVCELDFVLTGFHFHCFSTSRSRTHPLPKKDSRPSMVEESNAFYVVRKGDIVGIYKSLSDCQAQVSVTVCGPPVSVYKGYGLRKETEEYLASRGLKNPLYSVNASDMKEDLFGALLPCPFQQPDGLADILPKKMSSLKRTKDMETAGSGSVSTEQSKKHLKKGSSLEAKTTSRPNETARSGSVSTEQSKKHLKKGSSLEAKTTSRPNETAGSGSVSIEQSKKHLKKGSSLEAKTTSRPDETARSGSVSTEQSKKHLKKGSSLEAKTTSRPNETARSGSVSTEQSKKHLKKGSSLEAKTTSRPNETAGSGSVSTEQSKKHLKKGSSLEAKTTSRPNETARSGSVSTEQSKKHLKKGLHWRQKQHLETAGSGSVSIEQSKKHLKKGSSLEAKTTSRPDVEDRWQTKNENMASLCKEVKSLKDSFLSFHVNHVKREFNSDADAQANLAVDLPTGEVTEELD
ncbi:hypothetical protein C4D60_Mb09t14970 [Musa balbisiana]|uniref:Uncharacterized protein n=1 Tax=Musa balbisiana TaxID=52838 RepID=A0A4S8IHB1_MUSBA|nr:hypothetical protein C4D60_Mb09t14970 [Musa balbisiana]